MIKELSPRTAKKILETLIVEGRVDSDEVLRAIIESPSPEMQRMVDIMHDFLCMTEHGDPKDLGKKFKKKKLCFYPVEENLEGVWSHPFHKKWLSITLSVMEQLGVGTEEGLQKVVKQVKELVKLHEAAIRLYITIRQLEPVKVVESSGTSSGDADV